MLWQRGSSNKLQSIRLQRLEIMEGYCVYHYRLE